MIYFCLSESIPSINSCSRPDLFVETLPVFSKKTITFEGDGNFLYKKNRPLCETVTND